MRSANLVQLIETHWEEIANRLVNVVKSHPDMRVLAGRPETELLNWCRDILQDLGTLLTATKEDEVKRRFEVLGKMRFEQNVPLHEAVLRLHLLKDRINGFVRERGYATTALDMYAEDELQRRIGHFFDSSVYHVVWGYEKALKVAQRLAS